MDLLTRKLSRFLFIGSYKNMQRRSSGMTVKYEYNVLRDRKLRLESAVYLFKQLNFFPIM